MARWKPHRNLRFLRLLLFQDQTCTTRPRFAPLPIRLEQKETKATKSEITAPCRISARHKNSECRREWPAGVDPQRDHRKRPECYPTSGFSGLLLSWVPYVALKERPFAQQNWWKARNAAGPSFHQPTFDPATSLSPASRQSRPPWPCCPESSCKSQVVASQYDLSSNRWLTVLPLVNAPSLDPRPDN